ncbi:DUF6059 family protein [Streptomyces neyagawaensis]|uniref:DUF6059 family protein n=1 Tax=Streptomyces neyagawaensis TaxID=42238 RepID=UPI0006E46679|nr:DUF6059 family protein [Streptomyces neyagawaensis]MCL6733441.1 hypothetical protein [Streptomyces neyagawaensis]MDE1685254.1 hypothetical protein [Streptomyces neyagawaensis]
MAVPPGKWGSPRRVWRGVVTFFVDGFGALAVIFGMVPPAHVEQAKQWWLGDPDPGARSGALPLDEPPPAHPERLVADVPLSPRERELWAQLEGHGRVEDGPGRRE